MEEEKGKKTTEMGRQGKVKGKVTGAEEKRATGKRGDGGKEADRHWEGGGRRWWAQRDRRLGVEGC